MTGLGSIIQHNETVQPNSKLLTTLKTAIPQFFDKDGNFKTDKFEDELKKNNIAEARDGYKLGFVGKDYARLQIGLASETMIVPDCKHNSLPENVKSGNIFITGDNLDALRHLVNAYENQVKLIYIDPPYNTGREFVYSDKFEFDDEKLKSILGYTDEEIARLKSIQGKSSHSAWLTFMYPRLKIAQRLLKEDGVIFISIDDNEQANLKLLMDDIFGEGNFVAEMIWQKKTGSSDAVNIATITESVLIYAKSILNITLNQDTEARVEERYKYKDEYFEERGAFYYDNLDRGTLGYHKTLDYAVQAPDGTQVFPNGRKCQFNDGWRWKWSKDKLLWGIGNGFIELQKNSTKECGWGVYYKIYMNMDNDGEKIVRSSPYKNLLLRILNTHAANEAKELFGRTGIFSNPKPVELIKKLIIISANPNDIILDFFAGSATTAHAVMQLNSEDGGNRKFIMVQLEEETNPDSEARKAKYNTIDEIARDRIQRAGKKILADYESDLEKQSRDWDKDIGFKHYRLVTPDVKTLDKIVEFKPDESTLIAEDMIKPFEYEKTKTSGLDTLLTTWLVDDGFRFDTEVEEIIFGTYKAHYVKEAATLYLINREWDTTALKDLLNQIGKNELQVGTIVIYPYSFDFESMRELKTNIKTNLDNPPKLIERY